MNDNEINITIAGACGFEVCLSSLQSGLDIVKDGKRYPLPNYTTDLNAMHEAEKVLAEKQWLGIGIASSGYVDELAGILGLDDSFDTYLQAWTMIRATARERAEAFLRTLGKWKD